MTGKWLKIEIHNNVYMKENKFQILSVDGTKTRFSFLDLLFIKMTTLHLKVQIVLLYAEFKSIVHREFRRVLNCYAPTAKSIKKWHNTFLSVVLVGEDRDLPIATPKIKFTPHQPEHICDLHERIIEAIESIPEDILQFNWQEIVHRLDIIT